MIKPIKQLADEAFVELKKIQTGENPLIKTGRPEIDSHIGGLLVGDCCIINALSGHGKSEYLFRLRESIMDVNVNPGADNFIWCNFNLEVRILNVILRGLNRKTGKKKSEILTQEFKDEDKEKANDYYKIITDPRHYVEQDETSGEEFYNKCKLFLEENKTKTGVFISFDHAALISDSDTKKGIDTLIRGINKLKLQYSNAYFFVISQLNRSIISRVADKNNMSAPNAGDIFQSSSMDFISNYNIALFDAHKLGIEQFLKINPERYDYLEKYFGDEDKSGKRSLNTIGNIFAKVIKTRESDTPWTDLFVIEKDMSDEDKKKYLSSSSPTTQTKLNQMPSFPSDTPIVDVPLPNMSVEDAFGAQEDDDNVPF